MVGPGERPLSRREALATIGAAGAVAAAGCADVFEDAACEGDRTDDAHLPFESDGYGGWGGHEHHDTDPGIERVPVVFAHGSTRDACDFDGHAAYLLGRGYRGDELWAITFGREGSTHGEMRAQLDDFVEKVRAYAGADRVDVVGHSLGVTGLRYWMDGLDAHEDRYDLVERFVGLAGANHGTWTCGPGCRAGPGTTRVCGFISHACADAPGGPLYELNHPDETPVDVAYHTIRGTDDDYFRFRPASPALAGAAENVALDGADHDGVRTREASKELVYEWLSGSPG